MTELFTPRQTAEALQITVAALSRFRHERRGPVVTRVGKLIRYRRDDLMKWLDSQRDTDRAEERRG